MGVGGKGGVELARALVGVAKLLHDSLDLLTGGERQRQVRREGVGFGWGRRGWSGG